MKKALNVSNQAIKTITAPAAEDIAPRTSINEFFLDALRLAIKRREDSSERVSEIKGDMPALVHTIMVDEIATKVRIATDSRCSGIALFLKHYTPETLILSATASTKRLLIADQKIPSCFIYEVALPKAVKVPK